MRRKPNKGVELDQTPEYQNRLREVMADMQTPHEVVHLEGGPCVESAPPKAKFTPDVYLVTCEVCQVTVAMLDDTPSDDDDWRGVVDRKSLRVQEELAGDPDPYALALWKAKHGE